MKMRFLLVLIFFPAKVGLSVLAKPPCDLLITFGAKGLERLSYEKRVLEDVSRWPDDQFHIWHMKALSRDGRYEKNAGNSWGENNLGRSWDSVTKTWTYRFQWGAISAHYFQHDNAVTVTITTMNKSNSGLMFDGATIYPLTLHPGGEASSVMAAGPQIADGVEAPTITASDLGNGQMAVISSDAGQPLWTGYQLTKDKGLSALLSGTIPDGVRPDTMSPGSFVVNPGKTVSMELTVQFLASSHFGSAAGDAIASFRNRWPDRLDWKDRRLIGTVYLASSGEGDKVHPTRTPNDPRRYLAGADLEMRSPEGLKQFQNEILEQAETIVSNLRRMDAQGVITWDIEGQEYPHNTSYVCAPDTIGRTAPEMESIVTNRTSKYVGMKLDDAYFKTIKDAGFRVGVCVRPQRFTKQTNGGGAAQVFLSDAEAATELIRKMKYAHDRWGATLFYADSTVRADGSPLRAATLDLVANSLPDSLLIPEEVTMRSYRATAPLQAFIFREDTGTSEVVHAVYPRAFSANLINDVNPVKLEAHRKELIQAVRNGDVLMIHADYWQKNNFAVTDIYKEAKRRR